MTDGESDDVPVRLTGGRFDIVFNHPARKNALTDSMYLAVIEALGRPGAEEDVKVVVLSGSDGNFTAGHDLGGFISAHPGRLMRLCSSFVRALSRLSKPVIATVDGIAVGIGTTMLLHCDLVYVGERARFRLPFVGQGLVPEAASSALLPALCGHQRAKKAHAQVRNVSWGDSRARDRPPRGWFLADRTGRVHYGSRVMPRLGLH